MVARLRRLARPRMVIGYRWEGGAPLIIGASPYARLFNPFGAPWSILFDLRSSLLTLGRAQASLALLSLTRSLHLSPFTFDLRSSLLSLGIAQTSLLCSRLLAAFTFHFLPSQRTFLSSQTTSPPPYPRSYDTARHPCRAAEYR